MNIKERISKLPDYLNSVKEFAKQYIDPSISKIEDDILFIGHQPEIAPKYYRLIIWPGISNDLIMKYERINQIQIPEKIQHLLSASNGISLLGLDIFGIPESMLNEPPLLDRSKLQCKDISMAKDWFNSNLDTTHLFYFGARHWTYEQNCSYFLTNDERIESYLENGDKLYKWDDFHSFFSDEIEGAVEYESQNRIEFKVPWWQFWRKRKILFQ